MKGIWRIDGDELVCEPSGAAETLTFGDPTWTDIDFTYRCRRNNNVAAMASHVRNDGQGNFVAFCMGKYGGKNNWCEFYCTRNGEKWARKNRRGRGIQMPANTWFQVHISCRGPQLVAAVDGREIARVNRDDFTAGCIAFSAHKTGQLRFRDVKVTAPDGTLLWQGLPDLNTTVPNSGPPEPDESLDFEGAPESEDTPDSPDVPAKPTTIGSATSPSPSPAEETTAQSSAAPSPPTTHDTPADQPAPQPPPSGHREKGFTALFDGKNLRGWSQRGNPAHNWRLQDGMMIGNGPRPASWMALNRKKYSDFHLRIELFIPYGFAHVAFRQPDSDDEFAGYLLGLHKPELRLKSPLAPQRVLKDVPESAAELNKWRTYDVIAKGPEITVRINGNEAYTFTDPSNTFRSGGISISCGANSEIRVRRVEIKDLTK